MDNLKKKTSSRTVMAQSVLLPNHCMIIRLKMVSILLFLGFDMKEFLIITSFLLLAILNDAWRVNKGDPL